MEAINVDIEHFRAELLDNVENNILNYWIGKMVDPRGGFYGRRDGYDRLDADAPKGAILNGRILWSFAAAYRVTRKPEYLEMAQRAKRYILVAQCRRHSARHQETVLCHWVCYLRA